MTTPSADAALPLVTILVPMRNEEAYIDACVASLQQQQYPHLEILVLDGASTDQSAALVATRAHDDPRLRLLPNPARLQAAALNVGAHAATGEIIMRADAHAVYGPAYVSTCVTHLLSGAAENVGGCQRAVGTTPFTRALAAALNSPLGAGNAAYRVARAPQYTDTVWLGAWRRETLNELGGFAEDLAANEDYECNIRLRKRGGRILLDPALESTYYPRATPGSLWRQYFRYGIAKIRVLRRHPDSLAPRQLAPPLCLLLLCAALIGVPRHPLPLLLLGCAYLLVLGAGAVTAARRAGWATLPWLFLIYPTIHLAWALGFWWGLLATRG